MKTIQNLRSAAVCFAVIITCLSLSKECWALTRNHHLYNAGKNLVFMAGSPLKGVFVFGPQNVKAAYIYEVYEREHVEDTGQLKYKLFGIWRAPGEEIKGIVKGLVNTVDYAGKTITEFASIIWSD